jgi:hypothetical protein
VTEVLRLDTSSKSPLITLTWLSGGRYFTLHPKGYRIYSFWLVTGGSGLINIRKIVAKVLGNLKRCSCKGVGRQAPFIAYRST